MGLWVWVWVQACALPNNDDENVVVMALVSLRAVELSRGGWFYLVGSHCPASLLHSPLSLHPTLSSSLSPPHLQAPLWLQ